MTEETVEGSRGEGKRGKVEGGTTEVFVRRPRTERATGMEMVASEHTPEHLQRKSEPVQALERQRPARFGPGGCEVGGAVGGGCEKDSAPGADRPRPGCQGRSQLVQGAPRAGAAAGLAQGRGVCPASEWRDPSLAASRRRLRPASLAPRGSAQASDLRDRGG